MNAYIIRSGKTVFRRITKAAARRAWACEARNIALCPANLRPGFPWAPHITFFAAEQSERLFDQTVNTFIYFNCTDRETGLYPAFYLVEESI